MIISKQFFSSRSRTPPRQGLRSDDFREINRRNYDSRPHERPHHSRQSPPFDPYSQRRRSPSSHRHSRSPQHSSRYERSSRRSPARQSPPQHSSRRSPPRRSYYDEDSSRSPPVPYYDTERTSSQNSGRQQRWMDSDDYQSRPDVTMQNANGNASEANFPRRYLLNNPPTDFNPGAQREFPFPSPNGTLPLEPKIEPTDPRYQTGRSFPVKNSGFNILPTVDLTKPPPPLPNMPGFGVPPPGGMPSFNVPPPGMVPGMMPGMPGAMPPPVGGMQQPMQYANQIQPVDQAELVKKAKMELYNRDLQKITSRGQLVEYCKFPYFNCGSNNQKKTFQ